MRAQPDVAVVTVCPVSCLGFLEQLASSLARQTFREFDWVLSCSNFRPELALERVAGIIRPVCLTASDDRPTLNRLEAVAYCQAQGYRYLIFQDADDWMTPGRVEDALRHLQSAPIVVHDLILADADCNPLGGPLWGVRVGSNPATLWTDFVREQNIFGLSNTSVRADLFTGEAPPSGTIALDWFLFFQLLQRNEAIFSGQEATYYRQYEHNVAGIRRLSEQRIAHVINVKSYHYKSLIKAYPFLRENVQRLEQFTADIFRRPIALEAYIAANAGLESPFWWEETTYPAPS